MTRMQTLARDIQDTTAQLDVYRTVRRTYKGVKALCAATASEYLRRAGYLSIRRTWTAELYNALAGKGAVRFDALDECEPYTLCYSVDRNGNGAPDHVFFFLRWLDEYNKVAEVIDNYSPYPHPRNLGAPVWYKGIRRAYGRFWYGQKLPD